MIGTSFAVGLPLYTAAVANKTATVWAASVGQEVRGIEGRAKQRAQELMARETLRPLSTEQERAIDEVVTEAWARRRERAQV